jgi:hypothetical protein
MSVIPAIQEAEVGEWSSMVHPHKSTRLYLKNKLKTKGLGVWLRGIAVA